MFLAKQVIENHPQQTNFEKNIGQFHDILLCGASEYLKHVIQNYLRISINITSDFFIFEFYIQQIMLYDIFLPTKGFENLPQQTTFKNNVGQFYDTFLSDASKCPKRPQAWSKNLHFSKTHQVVTQRNSKNRSRMFLWKHPQF